MTHYQELKNIHVEPVNCFYAFGNQQFAEAVKKQGLEGQKLYSAGSGLYGTHEGIKNYFAEIEKITKRIPKECTPQEVYDYEFANHECGYVGSDGEAIDIVRMYFGFNAIVPKRRYAVDNFPSEDPQENYRIFWHGVIQKLDRMRREIISTIADNTDITKVQKLRDRQNRISSAYFYALKRNGILPEVE